MNKIDYTTGLDDTSLHDTDLAENEVEALADIVTTYLFLENLAIESRGGANGLEKFIGDACWRQSHLLFDAYKFLAQRLIDNAASKEGGHE